MKTKIITGLTLLYFIVLNSTYAQQIKPLTLGSTLPELQFNHVYSEPVKQVMLSDYKGKAILIDFWATWCSPCVMSLPFLDSLQSHYTKDLQVICITREDDKLVRQVIDRLFHGKKPSFLTVLKDSVLEKYFPHQTIPHCIWVGKDGNIKAITEKNVVTYKNVQNLINGSLLQLTNKPQDIKYDNNKPPYASKQVKIEAEFLYHSMVTKSREGLQSSMSRGIKNDFITCLNSPVTRLYQIAFGKFNMGYLDMNRIVCKGFSTFADSVKIGLFTSDKLIHSWENDIQQNAFSYELATRDTVYNFDELFEIMQQDLNRYFGAYGITGHVEKRNKKVMALIEIGGPTGYQSKGGKPEHYATPDFLKISNERIAFFLSQLQPYLQKDVPPIVNETGYNGNITIEINYAKNTISSINESLAKYGLKLQEKEEPLDMIVITKNPASKREL